MNVTVIFRNENGAQIEFIILLSFLTNWGFFREGINFFQSENIYM